MKRNNGLTKDRGNILAHTREWWKKPFFVRPVKASGQEEEKGYLCHRDAN